MKKVIIILIGIFTISLFTACETKEKEQTKENVIRTNTTDDVIKEQEIDVFIFENISLVYIDGTSTLETTVTNTSQIDQALQEFLIVFKDEKDEEIITLTGFVGDIIKAGEIKVINSSCDEDLTKIKNVEYLVIK